MTKASLAPLALALTALFSRAIFDKLLAISTDWTLVAHWAQAQSLFDLTAAVALAGIGQGLSVFAARRGEIVALLLRDALMWGMLVSTGAAICLLLAAPWLNAALGRELAPDGASGALAIAAGLMSTAPGLFYLLWQGRRERMKMLSLTLAGWVMPAVFATGLFGQPELRVLLWAQLAAQAGVAAFLVLPVARAAWSERAASPSWRSSALRRYIPAGLSIGILSPASVLWSRAELAHVLSWDEVAQLQALWRASEWVTGLAGFMLGLVFLPRMSAAASRSDFHAELARTWRLLCLPATLVIGLLWTAQGFVVPLLYSDKFLMPVAASALFLAGDALRLASWVPLQGLFATERIGAIVVGEWLSLPLFAFLLTTVGVSSLMVAGACYAFTYAVYLAFNVWCVFRLPGRYATAAA